MPVESAGANRVPIVPEDSGSHRHRDLGATFPAGFDRGLVIDLESYGAEFDTTVTFWKLNFMKITLFLFPSQTSTNVTEKSFLQYT